MKMKSMFKKGLATLVLVAVLLSFTGIDSIFNDVNAAGKTYTLTKNKKGSKKVVKNKYGSDYIADFYTKDSIPSEVSSNLGSYNSLKFSVSVKVRGISKKGLKLIAYAMDSNYGSWKEVESSSIKKGKTYKLTLDISSYSSIGRLGIRVASPKKKCKGAKLKYTVKYAKIIANGGSSSSSSNPSSPSTPNNELKYEMTGKTKDVAFADTPVGKHGKLQLALLDEYKAPVIVDANGQKVNLRGASTHGMHWGEMTPYVNKAAFQSLRDEWGVNTVRLVNYVTQGGYTQGSKDKLDKATQNGVSYAKDLGMYAIVDWHVHDSGTADPWSNIDDAKAFFKKYATMYKDYDNVIFEICNEPVNVKWYKDGKKDLYAYAKTITKVIRDCGSNAIIVCGTNTWSQDVDEVAGHTIDDGNVMYTFHFYAATHKDSLRQKVTKAYNAGIPIFVTEFGTCDASGAGGYDFDSADTWINLLDKYGIPYCNWSLCNKAEAASMLKSSCKKTDGGWVGSDLTRSGTWLVNTYRAHEEKEK